MTSSAAIDKPWVNPQERAATGRAARRVVPRSSHGEWKPTPTRRSPAEVLESQATTRVADLIPLRYERMLVSPFTFYRGAAAIMAGDLATTPDSGLRVQCCGDAHLANFGGFESPERALVFDINDFDETLPGPWEWDVKRLTASFAIAAQDRGFDDAVGRRLVLEAARAYRLAMRDFASKRMLDVWYARLDVGAVLARWRTAMSPRDLKRFERATTKASSKNNLKAFAKLTERVDGAVRIVNDPPTVVRLDDLLTDAQVAEVTRQLHTWVHSFSMTLQPDRRHLLGEYRVVDVARKVVGVGSVGTRCWIALLLGRDGADPLFLQIKQAEPSVLEPHLGKSEYAQHGQRVVEGQRIMQAASDIFLGWERWKSPDDGVERHFYFRQLWDGKASADLATIPESLLRIYAQACGWTLARAHARSGDRIAIAAYLGAADTFDRAMVDFAQAYALQNARDYDAVMASRGRSAPTARN